MVEDEGGASSYPLFLEIQRDEIAGFESDPNRFHLTLSDDEGNVGSGAFTLDRNRTLTSGTDWTNFLTEYVADEVGDKDLIPFGKDLFQAVIDDPIPADGKNNLSATWNAIQSRADGRPLLLTVIYHPRTERFAQLPLELLHDAVGFVFSKDGNTLQRTLRETPAGEPEVPARPRVLFVWACPDGSGDKFEPQPHAEALERLFPDEGQVHTLPDASLSDVAEALASARQAGQPFDFVHVLAHGSYSDQWGARVALENGGADAGALAQALRDQGVKFVFLCSCQTAVTSGQAFSGLAHLLLMKLGADVPAVVATQANLRIKGSATLVERFYGRLARDGRFAEALAKARHEAYSESGAVAASAPVFFTRPPRRAAPAASVDGEALRPLPNRLDAYQTRAEEAEAIASLQGHRLTALVGLPGIGKTEMGKETARQALHSGMVRRVIYMNVHHGATTEQMRGLLASALGQTGGVEDDVALARLCDAQQEALLLVLDNAEDLMMNDEADRAFAGFLSTLLEHSSERLRVLLTTRWLADGLAAKEVEVPPMPPEQCDQLLEAILRHQGGARWEDGLREMAEWAELLGFIDGHPRTLMLVSQQFRRPGDLPRIVARLRAHKEEMIVEKGVLGREDKWAALSDPQKRRLGSLVASMDISYEMLLEREEGAGVSGPSSASEVFRALSLFPAGLPESVAYEVAGGATSFALDELSDRHLIGVQRGRLGFPVPIHWYAERQRKRRPFDECTYRTRALTGFAGYAQACNAAITSGGIVAGVDRLLEEEANWKTLARWAEDESSDGETSDVARIAAALGNGFNLANRRDLLRPLVDAGIRDARRVGDRSGEANCLKSLGDLQMRVDDLEGAKQSYEEALPIYREIRDRLGEANCLQSLGDLQMRVDDLEGAKQSYEEALPIYREIRDRLGKANCLKSLGDLQRRVSDLEGAKQSYEEALPIYREIRARLGEANCLKSLGDLQMRVDDLEGAKQSYEEALPIYREIRDRLGEANCLKSLGDLQMRVSDLEGAKQSYEEALLIYREIRARLGEANCLQSLGDLQRRVSDLEGAKQSYEEALPIYREIRDRLGEANCLKSLGDLQRRVSDLEGAKQSYEEALPIYREIRDRLGEANCLQSLGDLQMRVDDLEGAKQSYEEALPIYREIRDRLGEANCLKSLGDLQRRVSDLEGAKQSYEEALPIYREIRDRLGEANCLKSLGDLQRRVSDLEGAKQSYEEALPIYREIRDRLGEANCFQGIGLLAQQSGNFAEAFDAFLGVKQRFEELGDGLGQQASFGYLARTAAAAGSGDQALLLAEASIEIGRRIQDRFGQTINLQLQMQLLFQGEALLPALGALTILERLYRDIGDTDQANHWQQLFGQMVEQGLPEQIVQAVAAEPEAARLEGIEGARQRWGKRDLLTLET